jgi:large subunit ribosomal protein L9
VILRQAGEGGQLYGSVNARDIAAAFTADGVSVDRQQVRLASPIKTLGLHRVRIALHPEVDVVVSVNVARSAEEAAIQADPQLAAAAAAAEAAEREAEAAERAEAAAAAAEEQQLA